MSYPEWLFLVMQVWLFIFLGKLWTELRREGQKGYRTLVAVLWWSTSFPVAHELMTLFPAR